MSSRSLPLRTNILAACLPLLAIVTASAQDATAPVSYGNNTQPPIPQQLQANTPQAATAPTEGVGYSSLFRPTGGPIGSVVNVPETPNFSPGMSGESESTSTRLQISGIGPYDQLFAFHHGLPPENAHLKIGPFYFHLDDLTAGLLYTDNAQETANGSAKWIGIMEAGMTLTAQINEDTNFALHGTLIYLPFQNQIGVDTIFNNPYFLGLGYELRPTMEAQIEHTTLIRDWPVTFADDFRIDYGRYDDSVENNFDYYLRDVPLTQFVGVDTAGPYHFGPRSQRIRRNVSKSTFSNSQADQEFTYYSNAVSVMTQKDLPNDLLFTAKAYHENIWYQTSQEGLPSWREQAMFRLESVKDDLRFKPYTELFLNRLHYVGSTSVDEEIRSGVTGPITENMFLLAEAGAVFSQNSYNTTTALGRIQINHQINDTTVQALVLRRGVSDFRDEIETQAQYNIRHQFGPYIVGDAMAGVGKFEQNSPYTTSGDETLAGASLSLDTGLKTTVQLTAFFQHMQEPTSYENIYTTQLDVQYQFASDLVGHALYRYRTEDSNDPAFNFSENLFYISLTKFFQ